MFSSMRHQPAGIAKHGKLLPVLALWQLCTCLLTILALVLMLVSASTHQHAPGSADEDNCIVCNIAFDALDDIPAAPVVVDAPLAASFIYLLPAAPPAMVAVFNLILPPSCGPPPLSA